MFFGNIAATIKQLEGSNPTVQEQHLEEKEEETAVGASQPSTSSTISQEPNVVLVKQEQIEQGEQEEREQNDQELFDHPLLQELKQETAPAAPQQHELKAEAQEKEENEEKLKAKTEEEKNRPSSPIHLHSDDSHTKLLKFQTTYQLISEMRKLSVAPVDTMGCSAIGSENGQDTSTKEYRLQCLISLVLSSQTKDQVTYAAMTRLKKHGCTVLNLLNNDTTPESLLAQLIYPVGFYKRKAQYIKDICRVLHEQYDDDIPNTVEGLMKLRGVGPKMAYLAMSSAWNNTVGIGVDTHVHRISNRLPWVHTNTPEETRKSLESFVPRELWDPVNVLLVGFGQTICKPVGPLCGQCKLRTAGLCAYGLKHYNPKTGKVNNTTPTKVKKEESAISPQQQQKRKRKRRVTKKEEDDEEDEATSDEEMENESASSSSKKEKEDIAQSDDIYEDIEDLISSSGRRVTRALSRQFGKKVKDENRK